MRYVEARLEENRRELAYRIYVSDSLSYINQNKYISARYVDIIKPRKEDKRTGDEIALDVIKKLKLKTKEVSDECI